MGKLAYFCCNWFLFVDMTIGATVVHIILTKKLQYFQQKRYANLFLVYEAFSVARFRKTTNTLHSHHLVKQVKYALDFVLLLNC